MKNWLDSLRKKSIFFITPDVKRGIGLDGILPHYHIICSYNDPIIPVLRNQGAHIFCLEEGKESGEENIHNSGKLLEHPAVSDYIKKEALSIPTIMYFKPSLKLDVLIRENGFHAIGNKNDLNEQFENKLSAFHFLTNHLPRYLPQGEVGVLNQFIFHHLAKKYGIPFVIQFGHGWAGKTTFFIQTENAFATLVQEFSQTKVKVSRKIEGFTVLNNCCIYENTIFVSEPAIQIDNIEELSPDKSMTCGRQWPVQFLDKKEIDEIKTISRMIGKRMKGAGFMGFFGIDFLIEEKTRRIYVSEINARLTASSGFFTRLELGKGRIPLLAYHMGAFLRSELPIEKKESTLAGSQVIFRDELLNSETLLPRDYGMFKLIDNQLHFARDEYLPEKLEMNEIIWMKRYGKKKEGDEKARIETKKEVLEKPGELALWLKNLLGKNQERRS